MNPTTPTTSDEALQQQLLQLLAPHLKELVAYAASIDPKNPFGTCEYRLRDLTHRLGAVLQQAVLDTDKKRDTRGPVSDAPPVPRGLVSKGTGPAVS